MRKTRSAPAPIAQVEPSPLLVEVALALAPGSKPEAIAGRPQLVQFDDEHGRWLVRGLSSEQTVDLIKNRHTFLGRPEVSNLGAAPVPHPGESAGMVDGAPYEVVSFLPGKSWAANGRLMLGGHGLHRPLPAPTGGLAALAAQVARFHAAGERVPTGLLPQLGMRDYLHRQRERWTLVRDHIDAARVREAHVQRWRSASQRVVYAAWDVLESAGFLESTADVASHGDLWPTHVLADGQDVRIVDWRTARIAHPLIDLAQMIARFNGWSAASLEEVVESYLAVRALTADERRLLPVFGALDLAVETGVLLAEAYVADIDVTSNYAELARSGAGQMLSALESIGWSIRKTNLDSRELRREAKERAKAMREPARKPRPKRLSSKRPKQ
jgi:aminoglycoside phosphotransferase (APT) family kinase protein